MKTTRALILGLVTFCLLATAFFALLHLEISVPALFEMVTGVVVSLGLVAFLLGAAEPAAPVEPHRPPQLKPPRRPALLHRLAHAH